MKVLGIVCSPRKHGNTEILVQAALAKAREGGAEVELVTLAGKTVSPVMPAILAVRLGGSAI